MKTATVADLRNHFSRIAKWIEEGQPITITRRGRSFATLLPTKPVKATVGWPDLAVRRGGEVSGASLPQPAGDALDYARGEY